MKWRFGQKAMQRYLGSQQGSVAMIIGLSLFVLLMGAGVAVDMVRAQMLQSKLQTAIDASGAAAMASLSNVPAGQSKQQWAQAQAQRYFNANFPSGYLSTSAVTVTAALGNGGTQVTVQASTTQNTTLMKLFGVDTVTVGATSKVDSLLNNVSTELVLVLDNTASMNCDVAASTPPCTDGPTSKITALKVAANTLLDAIYGDSNDALDGLYVGMVPFSQAVNIGQGYKSWLAADPEFRGYNRTGQELIDFYDWGNTGGTWGGCVTAWKKEVVDTDSPANGNYFDVYWNPPEPALDYPFTAPSQVNADLFIGAYGYYYNMNPLPSPPVDPVWRIPGWRDDTVTPSTYLTPLDTTHQGPNFGCPQPLTPMVRSKTAIKASIAAMLPAGDTVLNEGMAWGWRMLSPTWRGQWGGEMNTYALPLDYHLTNSRKIIVFMSDGWNHVLPFAYNANGFGWTMYKNGMASGITRTIVQNKLNSNFRKMCTRIKATGTIIYTIGFGKSGNTADDFSSVNVSLLKQCATDAQHFYLAPSNEDLDAAFKQIGQSISGLRISK